MIMANWRWYIQMKRMEEQRKICTTISAHTLHKQYCGVHKAGYTNVLSRTETSLRLKYNQQKVETTSEHSSVPVRTKKIPRKIYTI